MLLRNLSRLKNHLRYHRKYPTYLVLRCYNMPRARHAWRIVSLRPVRSGEGSRGFVQESAAIPLPWRTQRLHKHWAHTYSQVLASFLVLEKYQTQWKALQNGMEHSTALWFKTTLSIGSSWIYLLSTAWRWEAARENQTLHWTEKSRRHEQPGQNLILIFTQNELAEHRAGPRSIFNPVGMKCNVKSAEMLGLENK